VNQFISVVGKWLAYGLLFIVVIFVSGLVWLRWDAYQPRDDYFDERLGHLVRETIESSDTSFGQLSEQVLLVSDSGLRVSIRTIRDPGITGPQATMIVLGGHRTGSDAVDLFGDVGTRVVVGVDYPYEGPEKVRGMRQTLATIPEARQALLDTPPAVSLVVDWLLQQPWSDPDNIVIVGASLGVPFAASAAARDERITGVMLVHGAADNRLWLEAQLERRIDTGFLHYPLSVLLHWIAYGPVYDTSRNVGEIAPRPVVIVGAREDERTPAGQAELLYALARQPKCLRWTEGAHIEPGRSEIIAGLLRIADEEQGFLAGGKPENCQVALSRSVP
jgi:dienelactone hydrolase